VSKKGIVLRHRDWLVGQFAITVALIIGSFIVTDKSIHDTTRIEVFNIDQMLIIKPPNLTR